MPEMNGLLSGKYDSTKQRAVLLNGDRLRNYRSYTATMRMELLLTGHLIFTDAQFFDGLYFHWLAASKTEFDAFKELMVPFSVSYSGKEPLFSISVKCRKAAEDKDNSKDPDLEQVAIKMCCKQFQFSSIEHDDLARAVFELSNDYSESYLARYGEKNTRQIHAPEKTLQEYIQFMESQLRSYKGPNSSIARNWNQYAQKLEPLFDIKGLANKWGARGDEGWCADYRLKEYLDQPYMVDPAGKTYREKMEELLEQAEGPGGMGNDPIAARYFARIRDELNRSISNRSKITTSLDELERLNILGHNDEISVRVRGWLQDFRQLMNDRYNKALARQHGCQFLDLCDYPEALKKTSKATDILHTIVIPHKLVNSLANLSWKDFVEQIKTNKPELEHYFNEWTDVYKGFPEVDIERVKTCLNKYLTQLALNITYTTASTEFAGPWDEAGTCDHSIRVILSEVYSYPCYFIGGGSFESSPEGNEICILCAGQDTSTQEDMAVLRLRFDKETDSDSSFDTLLAPVCNPLNGGALKGNGR